MILFILDSTLAMELVFVEILVYYSLLYRTLDGVSRDRMVDR